MTYDPDAVDLSVDEAKVNAEVVERSEHQLGAVTKPEPRDPKDAPPPEPGTGPDPDQ